MPALRHVWSRRRQVWERGYRLAGLDRRGPGAQVWSLLDAGALLDAHALTETGTHLDSTTRRHLSHELEQAGYLRRALAVARGLTGGMAGRRRVRHLEGLLAVLSGQFVPALPTEPGYRPDPGTVLHVVDNSLPDAQTGYTLRTHAIVGAQAAAGLRPHVVTKMGFGGAGPSSLDGVTYHRVAGPSRGGVPLPQWLAGHTDGVAALARQLRPAVLHAASDYHNALVALAVGRSLGIPVVYETRGFWEETWLSRVTEERGGELPEVPDFYQLRRDLDDQCRREADRVVTLTRAMADRVRAGGVEADRISVVPNVVDTRSFPVSPPDAALAGRLGVGGTTVIGYVSSLNRYEGIDTLIEAYGTLRRASSEPVSLLVVGDGPDRARLQRLADPLTNVVFTGRVPHADVLSYYSLIDIFVVPRRPDEVCQLVTPLKPFEAFSTGRAVVLSNVAALAEIGRASNAAELFEAGDPRSLAAVLSGLVHDPERRRKLANAGAAWVRANAGSWASTATAYRDLYAELGA